jgi:hypothetical protein
MLALAMLGAVTALQPRYELSQALRVLGEGGVSWLELEYCYASSQMLALAMLGAPAALKPRYEPSQALRVTMSA